MVVGGGVEVGNQCPYYNCWNSNRNRGIEINPRSNLTNFQVYSGATKGSHDNAYIPTIIDHTNVSQIVTGGTTVHKQNTTYQYKSYLQQYKMISGDVAYGSSPSLTIFSNNTNGNMDYYVLDLKIYVDVDRFAQMHD